MSELGERYKKAEELVFRKWLTEKDDQGRSQAWKIDAVKEDRISGNDSSVMKFFVSEVESTVNQIEKMLPMVAKLCKEACENSSSKTVSAEPITPHGV